MVFPPNSVVKMIYLWWNNETSDNVGNHLYVLILKIDISFTDMAQVVEIILYERLPDYLT